MLESNQGIYPALPIPLSLFYSWYCLHSCSSERGYKVWWRDMSVAVHPMKMHEPPEVLLGMILPGGTFWPWSPSSKYEPSWPSTTLLTEFDLWPSGPTFTCIGQVCMTLYTEYWPSYDQTRWVGSYSLRCVHSQESFPHELTLCCSLLLQRFFEDFNRGLHQLLPHSSRPLQSQLWTADEPWSSETSWPSWLSWWL